VLGIEVGKRGNIKLSETGHVQYTPLSNLRLTGQCFGIIFQHHQLKNLTSPLSRCSLTMNLLPSSKLLCERCTRMTSTLEGLQELASRDGYTHLLVQEMHRSAASGCPCCVILRNNHKRSPHSAAYIRIRSGSRMVPDHEAKKYTIQAESTGHPFAIAKLDILQSMIWDGSISLNKIEGRNADLYPFTSRGKIVF